MFVGVIASPLHLGVLLTEIFFWAFEFYGKYEEIQKLGKCGIK